MDIRDIQYFMTLYEQLHFTRAAEKLGISQPTLSQQIKILETELGLPLFDRIGKKVVVTEAGKLLHHYGMKMLLAEMDAKASINALKSGDIGNVRIAVLPSDLDFQLIPLFVQFKSAYPNIQLQAISTVQVHEEVLGHHVDIGLGLLCPPDKRLVNIPLASEPYYFFIHQDHKLAQKRSITLKEIQQYPLVMYPKGYVGREIVEQVCRKEDIELTTVMETTSVNSLLQLVSAGIGGTIQPYGLLRQKNDFPEVTMIPITGAIPSRQLQLVYHRDRYISQAQKQLSDWIIDYFK